MTSISELVQLNNDGDLGELLSKSFNGQIGFCYPRKDCEFMIKFESRTKTPDIKSIVSVLTKHYEKLGYAVEIDEHRCRNSMEALVFHENKDEGVIHMVITTSYPLTLGDEKNHIRVTTTIIT